MMYLTTSDVAISDDFIKRPIGCVTKYTPSKGETIGRFQMPNSDVSKFSDVNAILQKHKSKLVDILFEASIQKYETPNLDCILAAIKSFVIVDKHRLGIKSFTPIEEGGIAFDMKYNDLYIHLQFDNEGDAALYIEKDGEPAQGWDMDFESSLKKLDQLLA